MCGKAFVVGIPSKVGRRPKIAFTADFPLLVCPHIHNAMFVQRFIHKEFWKQRKRMPKNLACSLR